MQPIIKADVRDIRDGVVQFELDEVVKSIDITYGTGGVDAVLVVTYSDGTVHEFHKMPFYVVRKAPSKD
jgi:hypothetical protein